MPFGIKFGQSNRNQSQSKVGPTSSSASSSATAVALSKPIQSPLSPTPERSMDHKIVARSLKSSESIADKKMKKSKEPKHLTTKQQQQPPAISPTTMIVRKKFDQYDSHQRIQSPNRSDISGNDPNEIHRMAQSNIQKSITNNIDGSSINIIDNSNEIIVGGVSVGIDRNSIPINLVRNKIGDYGDNDDILSSLNQTNLLHSHQQQQQPPQPPSTVVSQSPPTSVKSLGPNSINQIPTSRSFDRSNEAYRLAANQSNIHNGSEYQAYRNRLAKPRPIFGGRLPSSVAMKMEDNVSSDRKDNLGDSDHGESNDRDDDQINLRQHQHQHQHQQQQQYQQQSENSRTKSIVDDNRPSVPSKPPILPRQTSTMTPIRFRYLSFSLNEIVT
ncbi:kinesin-like protein KIF3A-like [Sarcoptes scabiei]|nr:kinesin-like protein KIF3A-like [Sarcoptes scabiei]